MLPIALFVVASAMSAPALPAFSASALPAEARRDIDEYVHADGKGKDVLGPKIQMFFPQAFDANGWAVQWDKLSYKATPEDIKRLFGTPDEDYLLIEKPDRIIGLPSSAKSVVGHRVLQYNAACSEKHLSTTINGVVHRIDGDYCDFLRYQFYNDTLIWVVFTSVPAK